MLSKQGNYFLLETAHTAMLLAAADGTAEYRYYGDRIRSADGAELLAPEWAGRTLQPFLPWGGLDFREPSLLVRHADGSVASRFVLTDASIVPRIPPEGLPHARGGGDCLRLTYCDEEAALRFVLQLMPLDACDAIVFSARLSNEGERPVEIERIASLQLELWGKDFDFTTFDGAWGSERQRHTRPLALGKCENASYAGSSSAFHNPFVMLTRPGEAYACNLIYSGNHRETAEADDSGRTRLLSGINPFAFSWRLQPGESFCAPEAVVTYAHTPRQASCRMRQFVAEHILPPRWAESERPVLVNNWEGTYFSFTREKILCIASRARDVGAELFVLDDGWFGKRDDDTSSLGDWTDYAAKTGGIASLADEVRAMGLDFGIWVEPEMISQDSELYRTHPDYTMRIPFRKPVTMRNQLMLNLADERVQEHLFRAIENVIQTTGATYVKWDYNRYMTDCYDAATRGGEYCHRYILGLYALLERLTRRFPEALFEGCASGGGRFDAGILYYMPQIWTSDNTDARERIRIQSGTACAYPQSSMGAHVSASPNEQTGNRNSLYARFCVACGGVLGYESDLTAASEEELHEIAAQIAYYKRHRSTLQLGAYVPLGDAFGGDWSGYLVRARDGHEAIAVVCLHEKHTEVFNRRARFSGLEDGAHYRVWRVDREGAEHLLAEADGSLLNRAGVSLSGIFGETDVHENSNPIYARMYRFEKTDASLDNGRKM